VKKPFLSFKTTRIRELPGIICCSLKQQSMNIQEPGIYHIYNRGNNKQPIFFNEGNYVYFVQKCYQYLKPVSEVLVWCLMPNHFHFLIEVTDKSMMPVRSGSIMMPTVTNSFRLLQSSYTKGINKQQGRTGNLFQQKTKAKLIGDNEGYLLTAFNYIHQNPLKAGLVSKIEEWRHSSYPEYTGLSSLSLSNLERSKERLGFSTTDFSTGTDYKMEEEQIQKIF
jgi:REP element-mobilizing transposase RayT